MSKLAGDGVEGTERRQLMKLRKKDSRPGVQLQAGGRAVPPLPATPPTS